MITMPMIVWLLMLGAMVFSWFVMAYQMHMIHFQKKQIKMALAWMKFQIWQDENQKKGDPNGKQGIDPGRESAG